MGVFYTNINSLNQMKPLANFQTNLFITKRYVKFVFFHESYIVKRAVIYK